MNIISKMVGAANVRLRTAGQGEPLLFLHGFEGPIGDAGFLRRLADDYAVFAPEHPGFGESGGFESQHDIVDLVLHYRGLIEGLGGQPVVLMGHSLGGMFAAEIAALCPHLVSKLILIDSYGLWLDAHPMQDPFMLSRSELIAAKWAASDGAARDAFEAQSLVPGDEYRLQNLGSATKFMWPLPDRGLHRRIGAVQAASLVIHGEKDVLVPQIYARAFGDRMPAARVELIADAGHFPMIEQEDAFMAKVSAFLA